MRRLLFISLFFNLLLASAIGWALHRLGGWQYAVLRLQHQTAGLYHHRASHFERLDEKPGCFVFLGDSQTEQAEWHEFFGYSVPVLNRGIAGDFTSGVLARLPEVLRHRPRKIFLQVGVNDLIFGNSVVEIETGYRAIVQKIRTESPDTELFLQSVFPVNNALRRSGADNVRIGELNARISAVAREFALPYLDIAALLQNADGALAEKFSEDGLHLNGLGYAVWKKEIARMLE